MRARLGKSAAHILESGRVAMATDASAVQKLHTHTHTVSRSEQNRKLGLLSLHSGCTTAINAQPIQLFSLSEQQMKRDYIHFTEAVICTPRERCDKIILGEFDAVLIYALRGNYIA
jgi:hypothetical protein